MNRPEDNMQDFDYTQECLLEESNEPNTITIAKGDCLEVLKHYEDNSVDAIVTDPPYGLSFMGKKWDYDVPSVELWKECFGKFSIEIKQNILNKILEINEITGVNTQFNKRVELE